MEGYLDCREVALVLHISKTAVTRLVHRGTLPCVWSAGRMLFRKDVVKRLAGDSDYLKRTRRIRTLAELESEGQIILGSDVISQKVNP